MSNVEKMISERRDASPQRRRESWMVGALLAPSAAFAASAPRLDPLLTALMIGMAGFTACGWFAARWLKDPTPRHFMRLLVLVLAWTPVPISTGQGLGFGFSGFFLLSFSLTFGVQAPMVMAEYSQQHLAVAIAMSVVGVLGAIVIVARSWARLRAPSAAPAAPR